MYRIRLNGQTLFSILATAVAMTHFFESSPAHATPSKVPTVAELVDQLRGVHCEYGRGIDDGGFFGQRLVAPAERDCGCRGEAARLLGERGRESTAAVPALIDAVRTGPSDYNNGDGGSSCLSSALEAIGKIGADAGIPVLIEYVTSPRSEVGAGYRRSTGLAPAARALSMFGERAAPAVSALVALLEENSIATDYERAVVAEALGSIRAGESVPALGRVIDRAAQLLEVGVKQNRSARCDTWAPGRLTYYAAVFRAVESLGSSGVDTGSILDSVEKAAVRASSPSMPWIEKCFRDGAVPNDASKKDLERQFGAIESSAAAIRLRAGRPGLGVKEVLAILYRECARDPESVGQVLRLGDGLDPLIPGITKEANDLSSPIADGIRITDGCRHAGSLRVISLFERLGSAAAREGLDRLRMNSHLGSAARAALTRLRQRDEAAARSLARDAAGADAARRRSIAEELGRVRAAPSVTALEELLADPDSSVRCTSAKSLRALLPLSERSRGEFEKALDSCPP